MPIGLYIHIPFCQSKCAYCDFVSFPDRSGLIPAYVGAVLAEARLRGDILAREAVATVYLGGGTPSLLPPAELGRLLGLLKACRLEGAIEVSMEANPGTLDRAKLEAFLTGGGTRLSLGVQTHDPELLRLLGRRHTPEQAAAAVGLARAAGVGQVGLDLIYGLPGQTLAAWEESLAFALALQPDHLSVYSLELHPETPLARAVATGAAVLPDEDEVAAMLERAMALLPAAGLDRYEIANYARPGAECRHNLNYWRNGFYLGLGAGAHSHLAGMRRANLAALDPYLDRLAGGEDPVAFVERLGPAEDLVETLLLGLRLREGVALAAAPPLPAIFGSCLDRLAADGLLIQEGTRLRLTDYGVILADYVVRTLICALPRDFQPP